MPSLIKHVAIFGLAFPATLAGYHLLSGAHGSEVDRPVGSFTQAVSKLTGSSDYRLSELRLLEKDLWYVETRYVEQDRLNPEAMFQAALDAVEQGVPEVLFQREPAGKRLQISVGSYTTTLVLEPVDSFVALHGQLTRVAEVLEDHLSDDVPLAEIEYAFINGALSTLDPHTVLLPPEAAQEMEVDNEGEFGGLGIEIAIDDGYLTIKEPIEGTPAYKAGLQSDDKIVRIEDESTINMDLTDAVSKLRGKPGEPVTISVMRQGFDTPRNFTIVRAIIKLNPVEGELLPGNIAYIRIKNFNANVDSDIETLLAGFRAQSGVELKGLVLDMRSNPGGYLNQAIDVSDRFLASGVIVSTVEGGRSGKRETRRATTARTEPDYPITVLVNGNSASASEIVAGALRNLDRAVIIGERTFGKGSVQHLYENDDTSRLKLTVAKYLTPGDESIQSVGIPPDILLQPSVVVPPEKPGETPVVSLYWREWVGREADLDQHLEQVPHDEQETAYRLRYLRPERDDEERKSRSKKAMDDWEVQLAREVLLAAKGPRRAEVLASAAGVIARHQQEEEKRLADALRGVGIDWSAGPAPKTILLDARLDLGPDGLLKAGEEEDIGVEVTNKGTEPVYQISVVTGSDNVWLDKREFYFGKLNPGETRRFVQRVSLPDGYGEELTPLTLTFRDPSSEELGSERELVRTQGKLLPRFEYTLALRDDGTNGSKGDGDGLPEVGEIVDLVVTVKNVGEGPSREAFARLKNRSGRTVDLAHAIADLGTPLDKDGKSCDPDAEGCDRVLAPGESAVDHLTFELRAPPTEGAWKLELSVGDNRAYDYAAVQRGGFYAYFQHTEDLLLRPGQPVDGRLRSPPKITVTRKPEVEQKGEEYVISGKVEDAHGVRDVMIYQGDDKIFYLGGEVSTDSLPFSVDGSLEGGSSLFVVLARDHGGLSSTAAFSSWSPEPPKKAEGPQGAGKTGAR